MRIDVVTIFPEYLSPLQISLVGKAAARGDLDIRVHDLRDFTTDKHHTVDDSPYGGGPGMVMLVEPWAAALDHILSTGEPGVSPTLVIPTPSGVTFDQPTATRWSDLPWLIFACARYEGIDSRLAQHYAEHIDVAEVSIGDYVLAGGEVAALVMVEAVARLIPGVLGNAMSAVDDSFAEGAMESLLEGPIYSKPPVWRGLEVPEVLFSGHHARIAQWRHEQAVARTAAHRPDLLES